MRQQLITAINQHQSEFGLKLSPDRVERLADYYDLVMENNALLHLVAPCSAEEFAIRHILESLTLLEYLPEAIKFADVGAGGGLPSMPCLLVRDDLKAVLIESKEKKSKFLDLAISKLGISARAAVVNTQFQEADLADCESVTCRALDKFTEKLPRLLHWAKRRTMLLFGGHSLGEALLNEKIRFDQKLMPMSERRFLYIKNK